MVDEEYLAALLSILTNPAPTGIDPEDPYGQADDGIDRYDGFGRDVTVTGLRVVDGPYGDELEVAFRLMLPVSDGEWDGLPDRGVGRMPFEEHWRELSGFAEPAAYAPEVASKVMWAAGEQVRRHRHGGSESRGQEQRRARARAALPDREAQRQLVLTALAGEGEVTTVAPDRIELRRRTDPSEDAVPEDPVPEVITFVLTPDEWEEVLVDQDEYGLGLALAETLSMPDPDERFVVFYEGGLRRSTRTQLPPVRGRARERALAQLQATHPLGPGDGWYAFDPSSSAGEDLG